MQPNAMTHAQFIEATKTATWATIDDLVKRLDDSAFWSEEFVEASLFERKKQWVRKEIKRVTDDEGWPIFASIATTDPVTGEEMRRYKQEMIFDRDDYRQVVGYHMDRSHYHKDMAVGYAQRAERRFGVQMAIEFLKVEAVAADS